jgi:hypothetical protein
LKHKNATNNSSPQKKLTQTLTQNKSDKKEDTFRTSNKEKIQKSEKRKSNTQTKLTLTSPVKKQFYQTEKVQIEIPDNKIEVNFDSNIPKKDLILETANENSSNIDLKESNWKEIVFKIKLNQGEYKILCDQKEKLNKFKTKDTIK